MANDLSHEQWIRNEFTNRALNVQYRNAIVHASLIEGVLTKVSGKSRFVDANLALQNSIDRDEFDKFEQIRLTRNDLIHKIFERRLSQCDIDGLRDRLMALIHDVYKTSVFLQKYLFDEYSIEKNSKFLL